MSQNDEINNEESIHRINIPRDSSQRKFQEKEKCRNCIIYTKKLNLNALQKIRHVLNVTS